MLRKLTYLMAFAVTIGLTACNEQPAGPDEGASAAPIPAQAQNKGFVVHLSSVNTSAQGKAIFNVHPNGQSINYRLIAWNIDNVTMAHIHLAPLGLNGPVTVWLYPAAPPPASPSGPINGVFATGSITSANLVGPLAGMPLSSLVARMESGMAYVNVHTTAYPAGEIRGQF